MNAPEEFVFVARKSEMPSDRGIVRTINDHEIAVFFIDGRVYAVSNICPHQHSPLLAQGIIEDLTVTCPLHGWTYSLETGKMVSGSGGIRIYAAKLEGDDVYVQKPDSPPILSWDTQ